MTTQNQAFRAWLDYHRAVERTAQERQRAVEAMREILGMAQNRPPDGGSDGSCTRASWELARDIVASMAMCERLEADVRASVALFFVGDFAPLPPPPVGIPVASSAAPPDSDGFIDDDLPF